MRTKNDNKHKHNSTHQAAGLRAAAGRARADLLGGFVVWRFVIVVIIK